MQQLRRCSLLTQLLVTRHARHSNQSSLWYRSNSATQRLRAAGFPDYAPYMLRNGVYEESYPRLLSSWQPYLDGKIDLATAAAAYADAILAAR